MRELLFDGVTLPVVIAVLAVDSWREDETSKRGERPL
jgi:hypothetical protein